ncbi:hypothetical protein PFLUV_G00210550 [Perca fluviatilis]|uniref:Uncharacterized protein n=1 Tax=Perca fluviatilis TaxID=8168 RepID=A0A6A5E216_PERFL|nr:hypothetical protein PFLUV_G00210550 [Perca fluviatilis]
MARGGHFGECVLTVRPDRGRGEPHRAHAAHRNRLAPALPNGALRTGTQQDRRMKDRGSEKKGEKLNAVEGCVMDKGSPKVSGSKCHPPWTLPWSGTSSV